jgi:hypothetical protein
MRPLSTFVLICAFALGPAVWTPSLHTATQEQSSAPPDAIRPEPIIDLGELMDLFLAPIYAELQKAMQRPPQRDRKAWAAIYSPAVRLAEASNLLLSRKPNEFTEDPDWRALSAGLRQAAREVADATVRGLANVRPEDYEVVKTKYQGVSEACNACHRGLDTSAKNIKP